MQNFALFLHFLAKKFAGIRYFSLLCSRKRGKRMKIGGSAQAECKKNDFTSWNVQYTLSQ
jgi:hypothetical protein